MNTPLKHQQHSEVFEQDKMDGDRMGESQESFGYIQPGEKSTMHVEERLEEKPYVWNYVTESNMIL